MRGAVDLAGLTLENVERIEIVRGPGSGLYGSDAVAGVIQIITRRGGEGFGGSRRQEVWDPSVEGIGKRFGQVDAAAAGGRFDRLVVIAPSTLLPRFREHAPRASERIVAERAGDFVRAPTDTIERVFREAVSGRA